jgi:hypothetical protein
MHLFLFDFDRNNFFRLTLLLFRVGNQKLRDYFKSQWPIVYQRVTGTVPSPWQDTPHDATEMEKHEGKLEFKGHEKAKFDSGNTNDWDLSLLISVLLHSSFGFVPLRQKRAALYTLNNIRNTLICHATDAGIPNAVFVTQWTNAYNALRRFNATPDDFKSVEDGM